MTIVDVNLSDTSVEIPALPKEMISVVKQDGRTFVRINSSSLGTMQECPRKTKYSLVDGWKPESENPAFLFGRAIHKALETFYRGELSERILPPFDHVELMAFGQNRGDDGLISRAITAFLTEAALLSALPEGDKRSLSNGVYILWHYFKSFIDDPYVAHVDDMGPVVERPFTFRLHEEEKYVIDYFGTVDLVVRHAGTGELLVMDHKTSSVVGNDFYNRMKPNHQYTGYLLGAKRALGIETDSFLVNCLQVKERPKTSRGTPPHFPRQVTTRDESDYEEFIEVVHYNVINHLASLRDNVWPLGPTNVCANYGGCTYLSVCSAPKSMREGILSAKFVRGGK